MSWKLTIAEHKERFGAQSGEYPEDWDIVATRIKALAGWKCERCGAVHERDGEDGFVLTVHHLIGDKFNIEYWNLCALCQRCHLKIQGEVDFLKVPQIYDWQTNSYYPLTTHSLWLARHIKAYNIWAWLNDKQQIPLEKIVERSYNGEWQRQ